MGYFYLCCLFGIFATILLRTIKAITQHGETKEACCVKAGEEQAAANKKLLKLFSKKAADVVAIKNGISRVSQGSATVLGTLTGFCNTQTQLAASRAQHHQAQTDLGVGLSNNLLLQVQQQSVEIAELRTAINDLVSDPIDMREIDGVLKSKIPQIKTPGVIEKASTWLIAMIAFMLVAAAISSFLVIGAVSQAEKESAILRQQLDWLKANKPEAAKAIPLVLQERIVSKAKEKAEDKKALPDKWEGLSKEEIEQLKKVHLLFEKMKKK